MPVLALTEITAAGAQIALIGTAVFGVYVMLFGLKAVRRAL